MKLLEIPGVVGVNISGLASAEGELPAAEIKATSDERYSENDVPKSSMEAEFDTIAVWTERVVERPRARCTRFRPPAGEAEARPGCEWLADGLGVSAQKRFLDAGAGLGGPAAWLREHRGVVPVLAEPMEGACSAARRLFGLPTAAAWSQALPFRRRDLRRCMAVGGVVHHDAQARTAV